MIPSPRSSGASGRAAPGRGGAIWFAFAATISLLGRLTFALGCPLAMAARFAQRGLRIPALLWPARSVWPARSPPFSWPVPAFARHLPSDPTAAV